MFFSLILKILIPNDISIIPYLFYSTDTFKILVQSNNTTSLPTIWLLKVFSTFLWRFFSGFCRYLGDHRYMYGASLMAQMVQNLPAMQETRV